MTRNLQFTFSVKFCEIEITMIYNESKYAGYSIKIGQINQIININYLFYLIQQVQKLRDAAKHFS